MEVPYRGEETRNISKWLVGLELFEVGLSQPLSIQVVPLVGTSEDVFSPLMNLLLFDNRLAGRRILIEAEFVFSGWQR